MKGCVRRVLCESEFRVELRDYRSAPRSLYMLCELLCGGRERTRKSISDDKSMCQYHLLKQVFMPLQFQQNCMQLISHHLHHPTSCFTATRSGQQLFRMVFPAISSFIKTYQSVPLLSRAFHFMVPQTFINAIPPSIPIRPRHLPESSTV
jgi:hypothetical protein